MFFTTADCPFFPLSFYLLLMNYMFLLYFFLCTFFFVSFLSLGSICRASFSPASDRQMYSIFPSPVKHGRHHANLRSFPPDSGHLAKNSCPMGTGIHRGVLLFMLYLYIYLLLNIDHKSIKVVRTGDGSAAYEVT